MNKTTGFSRLDEATRGLDDRMTCILYGPAKSGKSLFCLTFLWQGLQAGETVALVTGERPGDLLRMAARNGWEMKPFLQSKKLRIFEYPEGIEQMAAAAADPAAPVEEFRRLLEGAEVSRLVFDPLTPLMAAGERITIGRCRGVMHPITRLGIATLVVLDDRKAEPVLGYCKDLTGTVLRFALPSRPGGPRYLRLERFRERPEAEGLYLFEIQDGMGIVSAAEPEPEPSRAIRHSAKTARVRRESRLAGESPWAAAPFLHPGEEHGARPASALAPVGAYPPLPAGLRQGDRVLLIDPDSQVRALLRTELQRGFTVMEACGSMDAATLMAAGAPAAIVMALELEGESGIELVCRLRQNGWNLPIVTLSRGRAVSDQLSALAAGADVCLGHPVDGRILRLTVFNAVCRTRAGRRAEPSLPAPLPASAGAPARLASLVSESGTSLDLAALHSALHRETAYSREQDGVFSVVSIALTIPDADALERLTATVHGLLRPADTLFVGVRGVACVLADTATPDAFLDALWARWGAGTPAQANWMRFEGQKDFVEAVATRVADDLGPSPEPQWMPAAAATVAGAGPGSDPFCKDPDPLQTPAPRSAPEAPPGGHPRTLSLRKLGYSHE